MTEREFPPDPETPDTDEVETTTPTGAPARVGRRFMFFSERIQRDGDGTELHEVISVEEDLPALADVPDDIPDRLTHPYTWERFWRSMMRSSAPPAERWQGKWPWETGRLWNCAACGRVLDEVQAKGRPPRYCQRAECQRARASARQRRHRNAA